MFGLSPDRIDDSLYTSVIPEVARRVRPDVPYVVNSPSGGELPFQTNTEVTHYYGVGAYLRPLDDVRRAETRFASECLAFANVPCVRTVDEMRIATSTDPAWKRSVPRDPGVGWDFDDVRDHYLATLFNADPVRLRYADFARYLDLSRAVSCALIEHVFGEWRRIGSPCRGGLVWQWQDVSPGAGWGVVDAHNRRKPAWYALQRAFRQRQLILTDEGLNGLAVHVLNEAAMPLHAILRISCLRDGTTPVREAERSIFIEPRGYWTSTSAALLDGFFDITYAYRFGPPSHDVTVATLHDTETDDLLADACHFPDIAAMQPHDLGLEVALEHAEGGWSLCLQSRRFVQFLHIDDAVFTARENWLHLPPGRERRIALLPGSDPNAMPQGEISALNMDRALRYAGHA
jgi:beta-mannosidase